MGRHRQSQHSAEFRLGRRRFLQIGGAGALVTAFPTHAGAAPPDEQRGTTTRTRGPVPDLVTTVRRREDQLHLRFAFFNLELKTNGPVPQLVRKRENQAMHVVVHFLPQHVMEEAFYEDAQLADEFPTRDPDQPTSSEPLSPPPVGSRVAGGTRLAFFVPTTVPPIPYTVESLLSWNDWIPSVVPVARASVDIQPFIGLEPSPTPELEPPSGIQTAIELPWWLLLSPHTQTGWSHSPAAVTHNGRTELWHTRFGGKAPGGPVDEADEARKTMRAVWALDPDFGAYVDKQNNKPVPADGEDFDQHPIGMPFRTPLSPRDRWDLVISTSDYEHTVSEPLYLPLPVRVRDLMLSPRGASVDLDGQWRAKPMEKDSGTSLQSWRHLATMGRDHFVRIVRSGFLFPFGHGASLIKVSERKFRTIGNGTRGNPKRRVAYLFQRYFLVLRQREVIYGGPFQAFDGRAFPLTSLRCTTLITPTIDPPQDDGSGLGNTLAFVPRIGGDPFRFDMVGPDRSGRSVDMAVPVVFVDGTIAANAGSEMATLRDWYNSLSEQAPERTTQLAGQKVAPAEPLVPGDTDLEVHRFTFGAEAPGSGSDVELEDAQQPGFFPTMRSAEVRLGSAEATLGQGLAGPLPVFELDPGWIEHDFENAGPGEVFVRNQSDTPAALAFGGTGRGDRSGGVVDPSIGITALSRRTGTVGGDPGAFQAGAFDPADVFGALDARLIGDITLADVVKAVGAIDPNDPPFDLNDTTDADRIIRLTTTDTTEAIVTELRWYPELVDVADVFEASLGGTPATLEVVATITSPKTGAAPVARIVGDLQHFVIGLLPGARFLEVHFDRLRFVSETGAKTDVDVKLREVVFAGPLEFVNELREYLSFSEGGLDIDLLPTELRAGFQVPIPSITVGVFSLQNLTFTAGATLPFTGDPIRFRFGFNSPDNPFLLSVMIFGGGGFFELAIGADGVESFQAALEFGATAALNFGVASGSISITAGIYLAIGVPNPPNNPAGDAELTGFIKLKGELRVLGLVSLGLFMKAGFTYIPATKKAYVKGVVILEIDVAVYSGSVEIEYEKRFGGSDDPTFGQTLTEAQWSAYTAAFAPIGA